MLTRAASIACVFLVWLAHGARGQEVEYNFEDYVPCGPPESAKLEKALHWLLPVYAQALAPRAEMLERALPKDRIAPASVSKIEAWLERVLRADMRAGDRENTRMSEVASLRWSRDFIVGRISCEACDAPDRTRAVEFQADDARGGLTFHSASIVVPPSGEVGPERIIDAVSRFLNTPEDKRFGVSVWHTTVDGKGLCFGKLRHAGGDPLDPRHDECKWWTYIPFCMMDGALYVNLWTIDCERGEHLPESAKERWQEWDYAPRGPQESAALERELSLGAYSDGIGPRSEVLERAIPKLKIPSAYVAHVQQWTDRVLRPEFKPRDKEGITVFGVPKLQHGADYLVGYFGCEDCDAPDGNRAVEFQAGGRTRMGLTVHSRSILLSEGRCPSVGEIGALLVQFFTIPEDSVRRMTVIEDGSKEIEGTRVCFGRLQCEWDYRNPDYERAKWWSSIPFWITNGTLFVNISTVDYEHGERPAASIKARRWNLTGDQ